jgi:cytochrome c oxidase cbb3-type subunit 3
MQIHRGVIATACAGLLLAIAHLAAQDTAQTPPPGAAQQTPAPQKPPAPGGRGQGRGATFPAQQRAPGDPAVIARGKTLYEINCRACHGADLRGGDIGGPNLLRSQLVRNDQHGELILPVVKNGRMNPGMPVMPPMPLPEDDVKAIAEYIHSVAATMRGQGSPPPGEEVELNILVGDSAAGRAYFEAKCSSCHSATGDLQGIASKISNPLQLQNHWITGGGGPSRGGRGRGAPGPAEETSKRQEVMVTVTPASGPKVEGSLDRIDDFIVVLTQADGIQRSFRRNGGEPKVEIRDPLEGHRNLLTGYTDKDIHNVTAYLVTLK